MATGTARQVPEVFVVGSVNVDLVIRVPSRPEPGETVQGSDATILPGGKGANQAVAAARLDGRVALLARVGADPFGEMSRDALEAAGVDCSAIAVLAGAATGIAVVTVTPDGENAIVVSPGANAELSASDLDGAVGAIPGAPVLLAQLEVPVPTVVRATEVAEAAATRAVLNLSPVHRLPPATLRRLDPLVVNEREGAAVLSAYRGAGGTAAEASPPTALAQELRALGPQSVVVTLGAAGAAYADARGVAVVPAPPAVPVDTTGAGDAFLGALCLALARGWDLAAACGYGVAAGSAAVGAVGARTALPTAAQVRIPMAG